MGRGHSGFRSRFGAFNGVRLAEGCLAAMLTYATSGGLPGVVRAAVEAKGRVHS